MAIALTAEINGNKRVTNCLLTLNKKKSKYIFQTALAIRSLICNIFIRKTSQKTLIIFFKKVEPTRLRLIDLVTMHQFFQLYKFSEKN